MKRDYDNIYNMVNDEDFVTQVPLKDWGYMKYGKIEPFNASAYKNDPAFKSNYIKAGMLGFKVDAAACASGIGAMEKSADDVWEYYNVQKTTLSNQKTLFEYSYYTIALGAMGDGKGLIIDGFNTAVYWDIGMFFKNNKDTTILYSHIPETYYAYVANLSY